MNMHIIRRIINLGHSKAIIIPKSWMDFYKEKTGQEIKSVAIEVDRQLIIEPYVKSKKSRVAKMSEAKIQRNPPHLILSFSRGKGRFADMADSAVAIQKYFTLKATH